MKLSDRVALQYKALFTCVLELLLSCEEASDPIQDKLPSDDIGEGQHCQQEGHNDEGHLQQAAAPPWGGGVTGRRTGAGRSRLLPPLQTLQEKHL